MESTNYAGGKKLRLTPSKLLDTFATAVPGHHKRGQSQRQLNRPRSTSNAAVVGRHVGATLDDENKYRSYMHKLAYLKENTENLIEMFKRKCAQEIEKSHEIQALLHDYDTTDAKILELLFNDRLFVTSKDQN